MGVSSFKKILKGLDKTIDATGSVASGLGSATDWLIKDTFASGVGIGKTGLDIAKKIKNVAFEEMSDEALEESTNILEHLTKLKAKKSTNTIAALGVMGYGAMNINSDIKRREGMGDVIGAGYQPNMINEVSNPIVDERMQEYERSETYRNNLDEELSSKFGSASPDIVFALHDLRNRG